jgi:nucleoside-diphosphate-sugar epimerase
MLSKNFTNNKKKIIVTGAEGFIGKNIVQKLLNENYFVISIDIKNTSIKSKNHQHFKSSVKNFFLKTKINNVYAIIDLAAEPRNNYYYLKPELALKNISNIFFILNFIKTLKKKPILIFSSTKQIEVDKLTKNKGPYSISKFFCEDMIDFYSKNYGILSHIVRFTDVFSINNNPKNKALIKLINKSKKNENIIVDNINHNFEYISIDIICDGIVKILKKEIKHRYINFYGSKINILTLLKKINKILNSNSKIIVKKENKQKHNSKNNNIFNYNVSKNNLFVSKINLIVSNAIKKK